MLVKLLDYNVGNHWDVIKRSLKEVLEGEIDYSIILAKLSNDEIQAWYVEDDKGKVKGVLVTMVAKEPITEIPNLVVICAKSLNYIDTNLWRDTIESLKIWAKYNGLKNIVSYSNNDRILKVVKLFGADINTRLIKIGV